MIVKSERRYVYCTPVSIPQYSFTLIPQHYYKYNFLST